MFRSLRAGCLDSSGPRRPCFLFSPVRRRRQLGSAVAGGAEVETTLRRRRGTSRARTVAGEKKRPRALELRKILRARWMRPLGVTRWTLGCLILGALSVSRGPYMPSLCDVEVRVFWTFAGWGRVWCLGSARRGGRWNACSDRGIDAQMTAAQCTRSDHARQCAV